MTNRVRVWARRRPLATDAAFALALVLVEAAFLLLAPRELRPAQLGSALGWSVLSAASSTWATSAATWSASASRSPCSVRCCCTS
ncbi:hypothetical protein ACWEVO_31335, partial [Micromonospora sp. NPDC003776]